MSNGISSKGKKVYKLGFEINEEASPEHYPQFSVTLDGEAAGPTLLLFPLEQSSFNPGLYPILNCGCGEWGCGGYWVKVAHADGCVIWESVYGMPDDTREYKEAFGGRLPLIFQKENYDTVITDLLSMANKYKWEANVYNVNKESFEISGYKSIVGY